MKQSILVRSLSASAFLCAVALLPAGCASTPAKSAGGSPTAGASTAPAAAPAKKKTVDGLAKDQSRKSFDTQPVVLAAGKPLPRSTRPAAMPLLDATLAPESPKQVAAAPDVPPPDQMAMATTPPPVANEVPPEAPAPAPAEAVTPPPVVPAPVAPEPAPTPAPEPAAAPAPSREPTPEPAAAPVPEPKPAPEPEPMPAPEPAPTPAPEPAPTPAPTPAPEPAPTPAPEPAPTPAPEPTPTPAPAEPAAAPAPTPTPEPTPAPSELADGARVAPAQPAPAPEMPPEPSRPQRPRSDAPATTPVDERSILRGYQSQEAELKPITAAAAAAEPAVPTFEDPTKRVRILRPALASKVRGFANLTRIDPPNVHPGDRFIVYFELGNWSVVPDTEGRHVVRATYTLSIQDQQGHEIWSEGPLMARDAARTPPQDLFITRMVRIPASLPVGLYTLVIDATDGANGANAKARVSFGVITTKP
ncbi:MAG: hypothetical protein U0625_02235 [Phycisphaerales bacterium]